jgi:hypothetical protein
MSPSLSIAASLAPDIRSQLAIEVLALKEPFESTTPDDEVLLYLPITKAWLFQLILGLVLICHCSYQGIVELLWDLFDLSISIGKVHNRLQAAAATASEVCEFRILWGLTQFW